MNKIFPLTLLAASLALPMAASATIKVYSFNLDGLQEFPSNASPAAGSAQVTVDDGLDEISFVVTAFNLQGDYLFSHIHGPAMAGENASVVFGMTGGNLDALGPVTVGNFVIPNSIGLFGENKSSSWADQINAQPWLFYVNMHTSAFPGGEIRGQLAPVPEASTYAMMLGGLGLVGFMASRRRRSL